MPPLAEGAVLSKPTTLVVAQIDGIDMFHDSIQVSLKRVSHSRINGGRAGHQQIVADILK
jgi:hypothetical protein